MIITSKFYNECVKRLTENVEQEKIKKSLRKNNSHLFQSSKEIPGMIDKVYRDGTRVPGRTVNGKFVPILDF